MSRYQQVVVALLGLWLLAAPGATAPLPEAAPGFQTAIPACPGNVILTRPAAHEVSLSVVWHEARQVQVRYGRSGEAWTGHSAGLALRPGEPAVLRLDGLAADTAYEYRVLDLATSAPLLPVEGNGRFHTARGPGAAFTFTVQADSHLDEACIPALYVASLANALAAAPDFHVDLGDTFMTGKHSGREAALPQYLAQRYYLGLIGAQAPIFLTLGNHDGEEAFGPGAGGPEGLAAWSCRQRQRFFPNPVPDAFYSGNAQPQPGLGLLQDYYAWTWGDATFVVLDPYWTSAGTRGGASPWNMTLGKPQYDWLARTLRAAKTQYKFVFVHQLVGGLDAAGRGGAEAVPLYEWGGHEADGRDSFASRRPGWEQPIHALLRETGVTIVFHGHDHFFARQEVDGIVYQLVPQPAHRNSRTLPAAEYGYRQGNLLPNSGNLRVRVAPAGVTVEYVRAVIPATARGTLRNGEVAASYRCERR